MSEKQSGNEQILDLEKEFESAVLKKQVKKLQKHILMLEQVIREEGIILEELPEMSDDEYIATVQLRKMRESADMGIFDKDEAKVFETLQKALKLARGNEPGQGRKKKSAAKTADLIKIAQSKD